MTERISQGGVGGGGTNAARNLASLLARIAPLAVLAIALYSPAGATAAQSHTFSTSFGSPGTGSGQLELVSPQFAHEPVVGGSGLAVNDETGDVYVADTANHRISVFDPSRPAAERFLFAFGADVGGPGVDTCTTSCAPGIPGSEPGQFEAPTFVAVDNSPGPSHGNVYVGDTGDGLITKFTATGTLVTSWGTGGQLAFPEPFANYGGIATDALGNLWVYTSASLTEFTSEGALEQSHGGPGAFPAGISVDGNQDIFVVGGSEALEKLDATGNLIGRVSPSRAEHGSVITGVAASPGRNDVYAEQAGATIANYSAHCDPTLGICAPIQLFGEGHLHSGAGLAIDDRTGTVYAASTADDEIAAFGVAIEATIEPATGVTATTATLHGKVDPEGSGLTLCRFEYGVGSAEAQGSVPCEESFSDIGTGTAPVGVHADVSGLEGDAKYHFRLHATNAKGEVKSEEAEFPTLVLPQIGEVGTSNLNATSATLDAAVDPRGLEVTACRFEYGTDTTYGTTVPCVPSAVGSGTTAVPVSAAIGGLSPNTTYHFRVAATDANGTATSPDHTFIFSTAPAVETGCPNEALREENDSMALPDCRAYELVTPAQKNGSLIGVLFLGQTTPQIAPGGQSLAVAAVQCFAATPSCIGHRQSEGEPYEFARTGTGWDAIPLAPPADLFQTNSWYAFGAEAGSALYSIPSPPDGQDDFYARRPDGSFVDIGPFGEGDTSFNALVGGLVISTADLSHVVYDSKPVWSFDESAAGASSLYEYEDIGNTSPRLVGVSGDGKGNNELVSRCGTSIGGVSLSVVNSYGPLSDDGRIVYFTAEKCEAGGSGANEGIPVPADELYERIDGERTIEVSAPTVPATCTEPACESSVPSDAAFEGAAGDGTRVLFTSTQKLTDQASQDGQGSDTAKACGATTSSGCNLYLSECDAQCQSEPGPGPANRQLIDVSAGAEATGGPRVQGVVALSPDGTHTYFVAKGVLTEAPNAEGQAAVEGGENLYLYERDEARPAGRLTFLATLSPADGIWKGQGGGNQGLGIANVTPDGRFLVFPSHRGLTADARPGEGPAQIYRYDAVTEEMTRVSIGRRGFGDDGNSGSGDAGIVAAEEAFLLGSGPPKANPTMSADGRLVFFQSPVALAPGALDDVVVGSSQVSGQTIPIYAQNVYEWEAEGTRSCDEPGGCVYLLTDGKEALEPAPTNAVTPELLGTDSTGENVFIAAGDRLNPFDTDTQRDYYDLRVGGGFTPPPAPPVCSGDACKGPGTQAGAAGQPATPNVNGPGNVKAPVRCKKSQFRKKGRCVKKPKGHKKRHGHRKKSKKTKAHKSSNKQHKANRPGGHR